MAITDASVESYVITVAIVSMAERRGGNDADSLVTGNATFATRLDVEYASSIVWIGSANYSAFLDPVHV